MPKIMSKEDFIGILNDLRCGDSLTAIAAKYNFSYIHVFRCSMARKLIDSGDVEGLDRALRSRNITRQIHDYAKEIIFSYTDKARELKAEKREEERRVAVENAAVEAGIPKNWFAENTNILPELSAIFKTLAVAIDTMLEVMRRGEEAKS